MSGFSTAKTKRLTRKRSGVILISFFLFAVFLLVNVLRLDLFGYEYYKTKAYDQITTTSSLRAERGNIYDANMNLLATNGTRWRLFVMTKEIKQHSKKEDKDYNRIIASKVCGIIEDDEQMLYDKLKNAKVLDVTLHEGLNEEQYKQILKIIQDENLEDMLLTEAKNVRVYPQGTVAAHVLGFTGSDNTGLYGLEYQYNTALSGQDGYYLYAKDANGNEMPGGYSVAIEKTNGSSLVTTIDGYVQQELEAIIEQARVNHSVQNRVCGIVMDTSTGAILAMATSSPFDPNDPFTLDDLSMQKLLDSGYEEGSAEYKRLKSDLLQVMWSNKAISETYEPGSTFKIVTVSAALDSGVVSTSDTFSCNGYHTVGGWKIKCHKTTGHGSGFDLAYGLQMSCNPTMMTIAERLGADSFYEYIKKFGYFEKTNIDLPGEATTIFHQKENIGPTELATSSFGQRFKVTIINQLRAICSVANGGVLVEPYLVEKIINSDNQIVYQHETQNIRSVVSESVANEVSDILEKGVSGEGGAKSAYVNGYKVAAKTGTSQKFDVLDENGNSYLRIGSTVAFSPVGEEGGVAVIIVVDEPQSQVKYGSVVAAPYVSLLLEKILPYLEYESTVKDTLLSAENYVGLSVNTAQSILKQASISCKIIGSGNVITGQIPKEGTFINQNSSTIYLFTDSSVEEYVTVPDLYGLNLEQAIALLWSTGLNIKINGSRSTPVSIPSITSQSLPPGTKVKHGTTIIVTTQFYDFED